MGAPSGEKTAGTAGREYKKINKLDIVLHCGSPGAGKSTFFWKKLEPLGYERVNQDILKTVSACLDFPLGGSLCASSNQLQRERCLKVAREHLGAGRSVAIGEQAPKITGASYPAMMKLTIRR